MAGGSTSVVRCICGNKLCFSCGEEPHYPANCTNVKDWIKKSQQEGETMLWIGKNTKDCPQCRHVIEKNGGCNHMHCYNCKFDFCWICLEKAKDKPNAKKTSQELFRENINKYHHHYERYVNHNRSAQLEQVIRERALQKMKILHKKEDQTTWQEVNYIYMAAEQLLQCRLVLKWSYVFSFFLPSNINKPLFEFFQEDLEKTTEQLSEYLESTTQDVPRQTLIDTTQLAERRLINLLEFVEREQKLSFNISSFITSSPLVSSKIVAPPKKIELQVSSEGVKTANGMSMQKLLSETPLLRKEVRAAVLKQTQPQSSSSASSSASHSTSSSSILPSTEVFVIGKRTMWGYPTAQDEHMAKLTTASATSSPKPSKTKPLPPDEDFGGWIPRPILSLQGFKVTQVACGLSHALVLTSDGEVFAWGSSFLGQCGDCHKGMQWTPRRVGHELTSEFVTQIAAGSQTSFALTSTSKVFAWGSNNRGQLGLTGHYFFHWEPTLVPSLTPEKIVTIAAGAEHSAFLTHEGRVFVCGLDNRLGRGQLAAPSGPALLEGLVHKRIIFLGCGNDYTIAQAEPETASASNPTPDHIVYSFGSNFSGECAQAPMWTCRYHRTSNACCDYAIGSPAIVDTPMVIEPLRRVPLKKIVCTKGFPIFITADERALVFSTQQFEPIKKSPLPLQTTVILPRDNPQRTRSPLAVAQRKSSVLFAEPDSVLMPYQFTRDLIRVVPHTEMPKYSQIRSSSVVAMDSGQDFSVVVVRSGGAGLGSDLRTLLHFPEWADCTLKIGDSFSVRTHKALLAARCPDFATKVLRADYELSEVQLSTQVEPAVMSAFLEYLYTDAVLGIEESISTDLIKMADKFHLPALATIAQELTPVGFPPSLGEDLSRVLCMKETLSDVHFRVEGSVLPAHKFLLVARSPYFRALFSSGMRESHTGTVVVRGNDIPLEAFKLFLVFVYTDKLHFSDEDFDRDSISVSYLTLGVISGAKKTAADIEDVSFEKGWLCLIGLLRAAELYMVPALQNVVEQELLKRAMQLKEVDSVAPMVLHLLLGEISQLLTEDTRLRIQRLVSAP